MIAHVIQSYFTASEKIAIKLIHPEDSKYQRQQQNCLKAKRLFCSVLFVDTVLPMVIFYKLE